MSVDTYNESQSDTSLTLGELIQLPKCVQRRIRALKKLQIDEINVQVEFDRQVHLLEKEFATKFAGLREARRRIITGEYEPTDDDADLSSIEFTQNLEKLQRSYSDDGESHSGEELDIKGIPKFWFHVLMGSKHTARMIQAHDEKILKYLTDISVDIQSDPDKYILIFHFEPNEYFEQTELKKCYSLLIGAEKEAPFNYDGPLVIAAEATKIKWKDGKNVTLKAIKKKQKMSGNHDETRYVTEIVRNDSFFNFFDPPKPEIVTDEIDEAAADEAQELLEADYEMGRLIGENIVPKAVLYYTGEISPDSETGSDEDEEEEEFSTDTNDIQSSTSEESRSSDDNESDHS
ncbi:hypothetical protein AB6A40_004255 [Gnathostoma spinigerum]|uniref:Nucleosome assembly protein n=1 Tax=Gnathostoma spinigerum TaxID=75299 RepID=A0ABD6EJG2_9BILA